MQLALPFEDKERTSTDRIVCERIGSTDVALYGKLSPRNIREKA